MLIRWLGALMLLLACGGTGVRFSRELRSRVNILERILGKLDLLQMEVCRLQTPLPEILPLLTGRSLDTSELMMRPFCEIWQREIGLLVLDESDAAILEELGRALSRGDEPERAFLSARERLRIQMAAANADVESKCRLSTGLGICLGLLLAIVLI